MITILELTALAASGLLAGALLTEACILVPYWKRLEPDEFLKLHPTLAPTLFRFYAPLTVAGTLLPIAAFAVTTATSSQFMTAWLLSTLAAVTLLAFYALFFRKANRSFAQGNDPREAAITLSKWATLHNVRTGVAIGGFVAATLALSS